MKLFDSLLEKWLNFVALPVTLTENSTDKGTRIFGMLLMFPWFILLALFGPLVLGSAIIILIGCCIEEA